MYLDSFGNSGVNDMKSILEKLDDKAFAAWAVIRLGGNVVLQVFLYDENTFMSNASFRVERVENGYGNAEVISFPPLIGNVTRFEIHSLAGREMFRQTFDTPKCVNDGDSIQFDKGSLVLRMD